MQETQIRSLGCEDPLKKEMAVHSSILAWRIPWTEKPGGLQFMALQRVRHDSNYTTTTTITLQSRGKGYRATFLHLHGKSRLLTQTQTPVQGPRVNHDWMQQGAEAPTQRP